MNADEPAFPSLASQVFYPKDMPKEWVDKLAQIDCERKGISKRELFSAMAMQGILASRATNSAQYKMDKEWTAQEARAYADALLKALSTPSEKTPRRGG